MDGIVPDLPAAAVSNEIIFKEQAARITADWAVMRAAFSAAGPAEVLFVKVVKQSLCKTA